ncbi:hypothetical protein INT43_004530 [Umbelopsis isabellina]|uniref:F-box domain-containing protein n=1 Tax=Mortierella isabellina TaxID=91625 RepID=A0A8H7PFT3_MORIS|nr:hypothetical protein INT43_004530 [Umbelopsis isabellina]
MSGLWESLSVELRLRIAQYLTAQELQIASSSCKLLYQFFANQDIWENAYTSLLNGYPKTNFSITRLVRDVKRLDFVQSEVVSAVQQKTYIFEPAGHIPLYDSTFITALESHLGAVLPIDFVIFLLNFAHQITFQTGKDEHLQKALLASGRIFEDRWNWQEAIDEIYFAEYDENGYRTSDDRDGLLTSSSRSYMNEMTIACFSLLYSIYDGDEKAYIGLILDADQTLEDDIPRKIDEPELQVDFESMKRGVGKVVYNLFSKSGNVYKLNAIAESFTDYLVHWGSVVIIIGQIPSIDQDGYEDIKRRLPRHPKSLSSVLLPQYHGWSVAKASHGQILINPQEPQREDALSFHICIGQPKCQINIETYGVQQQMIDAWADLTPFERQISDSPMPRVDRVRQHTSHIRTLFDTLKSRLPVALHYNREWRGRISLCYYKCFLEHLQALDLDAYKYNLEELSNFELELRKELNNIRHMTIDHRRIALGWAVNLDAIADLNIDWSEV